MSKNTNELPYDKLTPEERFRLIYAAGERNDVDEQKRLTGSGGKVTIILPDHQTHATAFIEFSTLIFLDLLEESSRYHEILSINDQIMQDYAEQAKTKPILDDAANAAEDLTLTDEEIELKYIPNQRSLNLLLAQGRIFRAKVQGWVRFCKRLSIPPFALWESLPGYARFEKNWKTTKTLAFTPDGFRRWADRNHPEGKQRETVMYTSKQFAKVFMKIYHTRKQSR